MMLMNRLIFEYVGSYASVCVCFCVGVYVLACAIHPVYSLVWVVHSNSVVPFVVRLSGRIIDDFLTV